MSQLAIKGNDQANNASLQKSKDAALKTDHTGISEARENSNKKGINEQAQQPSKFIEIESNKFNESKISQNRREGSAPFQSGRQNVLLKSVHAGRVPPIKESPLKRTRGQSQNQPQLSPRAKKEINVNLMSHMAHNSDFNNSRGADTRGKNTQSGLQNDSAQRHTEFPMKQRYHMQKNAMYQQNQSFKPSSDSMEKLNEIVNLTDELQKIHIMKAKRDQMMARTQMMINESSLNQKSHQWSDTAQILEQITQSQYNMGRSDAKQQKELQMKIMRNHFNSNTNQDSFEIQKLQSKKSSFVQSTLKNYEFKNFKHKDSFLRGCSQIDQKPERRSSLVTNGFNLRNSQPPATDIQLQQRSKTPFIGGKGSPRKPNTRLFPPATKQHARERGGLNFSFKQSQDWANLNQDLRSEAIHISQSSKTRPNTKDKTSNKRTSNLQFQNMKQHQKLRQKNINCSTSPMSPYQSRTAQGFSRLSESMPDENKIKIQEENNECQNNIYNQLGSKFQSERSGQTKVVQSRLSTDRYGQAQNIMYPDNLRNPNAVVKAPFLQQRDLRQSKSPSPLSKTHQISITTSNCNIPNRNSAELNIQQQSKEGIEQMGGKQKMLNVVEATSKTMTNSQSMDNQVHKIIQTKTIDKSDMTSQNTQLNNNIKVVNSNIPSQLNNPNQGVTPNPGKIGGINVNLKPITYTIKQYEQEIQKLTGVKRKTMRPAEKRMLATQVFAIQAYDKINEEQQKAQDAQNLKDSSQEKNQMPKIVESESMTKLQKLKITLPINQNQNQPLSPADSVVDDQNDLKDFGPRLAGVINNTVNVHSPAHKKSFYIQLVEAYKQKISLKSKAFQVGNGLGIYNKIQTLSKKHEFDKMDAWTAAQILTEFPELAEELILPKEPLKVEEQLQCAPKELNLQTVKSPINSQKKSNNNGSLTDDEPLSSERVNKRKILERESQKRLSQMDSARNSGGEAKKNHVDTRENLHSEAVQQELRKITFKIDKEITNDRDKMLTQLEQLLPDKNLTQISDQQLRDILQELVTQQTDRGSDQITSGRQNLDPKGAPFFQERRNTQKAVRTSTFLPLKDRQAKQQFRIFVQNEKESVIQPKVTTVFEPIRQKQMVIERGQDQKDAQSKDYAFRDQKQIETSVIESGAFSGLSQNSRLPQPIHQNKYSRHSKFSQKKASPIRFPPTRGTKTSQRPHRNTSQLYHHQSKLQQHQGFAQMSPREVIQSNEQLEINSDNTKAQNGQMQQDQRNYEAVEKRGTPIQERIARVQSREAVPDSPDPDIKNQMNLMETSRASVSRPSTILGFDKIPPRSGGMASYVNQSPIPQFEDRRNSQESQPPFSIPQQQAIEDMELVGSKQMLATRTPVSQQNNRNVQEFKSAIRANGNIVTLENANDYLPQKTDIKQESGETKVDWFTQKVSQVSQVSRSLHPISFRQAQPSNDSSNQSNNIQKVIPKQTQHNLEMIQHQQFSVRTKETESVYKQSQQNTIKSDSISPMVQIKRCNIPTSSGDQQVDGNHGRIITSRVHERLDTEQKISGQVMLPEILSDQRSNDLNSDLLSPMQMVQKRVTNPFDQKSPQEIQELVEDFGQRHLAARQDMEDDKTSGERTTIDPQIKSYTHSHNPSRMGDPQTQIMNVNKIMIVDALDESKPNTSKNSPRSQALLQQKKLEDEQMNWQDGGNIQEFLDQQLQPAKLSNNCFPQSQKRYRGGSFTTNQNIQKSPVQNSKKQQIASQSPTNYHLKLAEQQPFQAGEYIKHLKRSVEKIDKKRTSKNNLDLLVAQINEQCQQTAPLQIHQMTKASQKNQRNHFGAQGGVKKSFSPKNASKLDQHQYAQYEFTSLGRNQMAVQSLAQNIWNQKQRQNLNRIPDLPLVVGTTFTSQNTKKNLQQQNNANFSVLNPSVTPNDSAILKNASGASIDGGIDIIKAINEVDEPESPLKVDSAKNNSTLPNREATNVTPATDFLLDKIIANAAQDLPSQDQSKSQPIMDMQTPQIHGRKEQQQFPMTNQSSAESCSELSPQRVLMSREISPESMVDGRQSLDQIKIKEQN